MLKVLVNEPKALRAGAQPQQGGEARPGLRHWPGSEPPRCAAHSGKVGAPEGNQNRLGHGFYSQPVKELRTIEDVVEDSLQRQSELSAFIKQQLALGEMDIEGMARLLAPARPERQPDRAPAAGPVRPQRGIGRWDHGGHCYGAG